MLPRRSPRWRRRLLLIVVLPALLLAALELALRVSGGPLLGLGGETRGMFRVDREGLLFTAPHWQGAITGEGRRLPVRLNNLGLRGPDLPPPVAGERRVLVLGDSFVFGLDVHEEETLPARLQERLRQELGPGVTVGNGGMMGASVPDQRGLLRAVRESFAPDLIVSCLYLGNDFVDEAQLPWQVVNGYLLPAKVARFARDSLRLRLALRFHTFALLELSVFNRSPAWALPLYDIAPSAEELAFESSLPPPDHRSWGVFVDARVETPAVVAALARLRAALEGLRELAGETPILVVIVPSYFHVVPSAWTLCLRQQGLRVEDHVWGETQRRVAALAQELGLPLVDLTPALATHATPSALYQVVLLHWTAAGHAVAADVLAPHVAARLEREP